jgi:hypothetical protein
MEVVEGAPTTIGCSGGNPSSQTVLGLNRPATSLRIQRYVEEEQDKVKEEGDEEEEEREWLREWLKGRAAAI